MQHAIVFLSISLKGHFATNMMHETTGFQANVTLFCVKSVERFVQRESQGYIPRAALQNSRNQNFPGVRSAIPILMSLPLSFELDCSPHIIEIRW